MEMIPAKNGWVTADMGTQQIKARDKQATIRADITITDMETLEIKCRWMGKEIISLLRAT